MSVLIQCSKHVRSAYNLSRHRISNTLISNTNSHISQRTHTETNNGISVPHRSVSVLPNRSFFSSTVQQNYNSANKIDSCIQKIDFDLRRMGRISKREIEEVLNEINISKIATPSQSLMILRCCGNLVPDELPENRTQLVQKIWKTINNIGVPLDVSHYNTLLKVYIENGYRFSPTEFLENLEKNGISPNRVTFQHLITSYCQNGDIAGASRILEYMRDKQLPINKLVFNALVMGHSQNGDIESAEGVLNVMKESNLEPSSDTYTLLASGYAKKGDVAKVIAILDTCDSKEIYLSDKEYLDIVYSLANGGHISEVDQIVARIPKTTGYNQDAINCIYKLITAGHENVAFKIFDTMTKPIKADGTSPPIGRFLISYLTKVNSAIENVIGFCNKLVSEGTNPKAFEIAAEMALKNGSVNIALGMFEHMKKNEHPIRQHYFWPLFVAKNKQNDFEGLKGVLQIMINDYEINPNIDTLRHYILPQMFKKHLSGVKIITDLQTLGIPSGTTTHALVLYLLSENKIRDAADIAATNRAFFHPSLIRRPLVISFLATNDITSLIVLLQQICNGLTRQSLVISPTLAKQGKSFNTTNTEEQIIELREFLSQVVTDIVRDLKDTPGVVQIVQELLENMYGKGLGINARASEQIQNHLQGKLTHEITNLLENLIDSNLVPKIELSVKPGGYTLSNADESTLENILKKAEASGDSKNGIKRQLLNLYCKHNNLEKATEFKNKLLTEEYNIPTGSMVLLLDLYLNHDKLAEAKEIYEQLKTANTEFVLDRYKVIKMTETIAKIDSIENAIDFLSSLKQFEDSIEFTSFQHANACWKLLNTVAESGSVENVQKMFDLIINNNYITVSNILLGPLIKVYILNNDIKGAMDKFEFCCKTYRCTPWKNELALKFIESEDASSLQVLTDLSTTIHGEVNSLYDLMLAFIDSGRIKQARKILETPGLRIRQDRINAACAKYGSNNNDVSLIRLLEVTKDITTFDRTNIFNELVQLYSKNNKVDEAMSLWTQMQEEDTQPSDHFMWSLSELLKKNNLEVPFTIKKPEKNDKFSVPSDTSNNLTTQLSMCLKNNNINKALELRKTILSKKSNIIPSIESQIIELLTREKKLDEAFNVSKDMLENNRPITKNILKFLVKSLSEDGNIASLEYLNRKMSKAMNGYLNMNSKIFSAYQIKGNVNDLLIKLETSIDENLNDSNKLSEIIKNIPGGSLVSILKKNSSTLPTVERLHTKVSAYGHNVFANSLWSYFMLNNEFDKADNFVKELENDNYIQYRHLLSAIRLNNNFELGYKLIEVISNLKKVNQNSTIGLIYSAIIDAYVTQKKGTEASNTLDKALEKTTLRDLNESAIMRLKKLLESQGQTLKYNTNELKKKKTRRSKNPEIHSDDSSSDDSSDDEKVAKV